MGSLETDTLPESQGLPPQSLEIMQRLKAMMVIYLIKNDSALVEIQSGLYIGSIASSIFSKPLKEKGITHVVIAVNGVKPTHVFIMRRD